MTRVWVQFPPFDPTKIAVDGCEDVDDVLERVGQETNRQRLGIPATSGPLTLARAEGGEKLQPDEPVPQDPNNSAKSPLIVRVAGGDPGRAPSPRRQYFVPDAYLQCSIILHRIASRLTDFYRFLQSRRYVPTMGEVLEAIEHEEGDVWHIRVAKKVLRRADDADPPVILQPGQGYTTVLLPNVYTDEEWDLIRDTWLKLLDGKGARMEKEEQPSAAPCPALLDEERVQKLDALRDVVDDLWTRGREGQ